jgi:hypothetical protein
VIAEISRQVFGPRWRVAACEAHYESTDGAHLYGSGSLGPWQEDVYAHAWIDRARVVQDWRYAAKVTLRLSHGGTDWSAWTTHQLCGA